MVPFVEEELQASTRSELPSATEICGKDEGALRTRLIAGQMLGP